FSPEDVNKLRYLIQTRPSQPATEVVHALVISRCLPRGPIVCRTHRTKLDDSEGLATSARARLQEKERSRGLASLDCGNQNCKRWQNKADNKPTNHNIHRSFHESIYGIFQWLLHHRN